jgi:type I restriction enzyme S subunit
MRLETFFEKFELFVDAPNAVAQMRELVLQLAVTGKLVEQREIEGSAIDLMQEIRAERTALVAARKIKARKSAPVEIDEQPFDIPAAWGWARLSEVGYELGQKVPGRRFTYIDVGCIDSDKGRISERVEAMEPNEAPSRARKLVSRGTVIYSTVRPYLLNIAIVERDFEYEPIASTAIGIIHPYSGIDNRFLFYWLRSMPFTTYVQEGMKGMAYPAINDEKFYSGYIPLPPTAEQKRIVAKVDELMALCDQLEAQQQERDARHAALVRASLSRFAEAPAPANLDFLFHKSYPIPPADLRKSILTLAVQGKLVPQDPNDEPAVVLLERIAAHKAELSKEGKLRGSTSVAPMDTGEGGYELPPTWVWVRFGEIMVNRDGERVPVSREERATKAKTYDYYGASGVIDKIDGYLFDKPLLLIGEDGANLINRSTPIAFMARGQYWVNNHAHVLDGLTEDFLRYIELHINAINLEPYVTGSAQPKMNQAKMNGIPIALPPLVEQRRIIAKVDQIMCLVDQLEDQLTASHTTAEKLVEAMVAELTTKD